jgi:hypothetical protein
MDRYIARANIDHYLGLLDGRDIPSERRAVIVKLLVDEEDRLGHDLEQLEFAESRAAEGRSRLKRLQDMLSVAAPADRAQAERLLANFEAIQKLLDGFCHHLRMKVNVRL